jgi:hypothetical protein
LQISQQECHRRADLIDISGSFQGRPLLGRNDNLLGAQSVARPITVIDARSPERGIGDETTRIHRRARKRDGVATRGMGEAGRQNSTHWRSVRRLRKRSVGQLTRGTLGLCRSLSRQQRRGRRSPGARDRPLRPAVILFCLSSDVPTIFFSTASPIFASEGNLSPPLPVLMSGLPPHNRFGKSDKT